MYGFELAAKRRASVHIRPVSRLLDQILAEGVRPLDVEREPSARVAGNCRHFTVLTVAALRAHGIPVRLRRVLRYGLV
jgi:transglutaminase-like putative cysteine protease